jgi:hypothetical protein
LKNRAVVLILIGLTAFVLGLALAYSGTQKAEVTTPKASYSFDSIYFHDDVSNRTYLRGGDFTIYNCESDTLEITAVYPPSLFNQSDLSNVYLAVWEGGIKPSLPGNRPDKMISAYLVLPQAPEAFMFDLRANTVSIELLSNETYENLGSSSVWSVDFVRIHTLPANPSFITLGIVFTDIGIAIILLTNLLPDRLTDKIKKTK